MDVEVTATAPAEVEADVLAVPADGAYVRHFDAMFDGRLARAAARAELGARWTNAARELVDGPPNVVTPAALAERAAALPGLSVDVLDPVAAGLPALAAVGGP